MDYEDFRYPQTLFSCYCQKNDESPVELFAHLLEQSDVLVELCPIHLLED